MQKDNIGRGIILTVVAMLFIAAMDGTGKFLTKDYPIVQIMAVRFAVFFSVAIFVAVRKGILLKIHSRQPGVQIFRSLLLVVEVSVFIYAFSMMPLADAHAVAAIAPLMVTLMAGLFLGEVIGTRRWVSVAVGFIGALIIIRPGFDVMSWQALIPLFGAFLWAGYQVLSRRVARFDTPETTVVYTAGVGLLIFSFLAPFNWTEPTPIGWALLLINGLLGSLGHYILIRAFDLAPAATLQPFNYALLVWAIVIGLIAFGDLPDTVTLLGAAIVVGAGVLSSEVGQGLVLMFRRREN